MVNPIKAAILAGEMEFNYCWIAECPTPGANAIGAHLGGHGETVIMHGFELLAAPPNMKGPEVATAWEEFHADSSNWDVVPAWVAAQIAAVRQGAEMNINISPSYLADATVRQGILNTLAPRALCWGKVGPRRVTHPNVTIEVMETSKVTPEALQFLKKLQRLGYKLSLDDLGAGQHADTDYVGMLLRELQPAQVKIDFGLVFRKQPEEAEAVVRKVLDPHHSNLGDAVVVIEGVPVPPNADRIEDKAFDHFGQMPEAWFDDQAKKQAPRWRVALENLGAEFGREFLVMLPPLHLGK